MIEREELIRQQLAVTAKTTVNTGGHDLELIPARRTPAPDGGRLLLDGAWSVQRWPFDLESDLGCDTSSWERVQQPGKVFYSDPEGEREQIPNWNRITLEHIDEQDGALLVKEVRVPAEWAEKHLFLRFDAIYPAGIIYVNGEKLGEHHSGLTPVEFELDRHYIGSEITIAIRLLRKHKFVQMDMPRHALEFAGLCQSAYLFAVPDCFVKDYHLIADLNASFDRGTVSGSITVANAQDGRIQVELKSQEGTIASWESLMAQGQEEYEVSLATSTPRLWNDEIPNLYTVEIRLSRDGEADLIYSYQTGFRRLELSPEGAKMNGSFVKFRGVNHLTFHPQYGMHTPRGWLRECLSLMKKANVNAIRTHFTAPEALCDLCDEMGFYLLQELPIDWGTNYIHDHEWVAPALLRLEGAIRRDRHHCSIMVWSVGNENLPKTAEVAPDGWNHLQLYDEFCKTLDPSRPTMFPPPGPANKIEGIFELRVGDVADTHYSFNLQRQFRETGKIVNPNSWEADMIEVTREDALERGWSGCWFSSEYGIFNAMPDILNGPYLSVISDSTSDGLSGENTLQVFAERLRDEWGNMRHDPSCLGGAYFPWLSCGAGSGPEGNPWGWTRWGEDANWGVVTADLLPKPQFWAMRVLFAPVWFPDRIEWQETQEEICLHLTNQYNSFDLRECTFRVQMNGGGPWCSMMRRFKDASIECPPGASADLRIPLPSRLQNTLTQGNWVLCRVTLLDPNGYCPVTADIKIIPATSSDEQELAMPIGPDAKL